MRTQTQRMSLGPGPVTSMVKKILIANGIVFLIQLMMGPDLGIATREGLLPFGSYFALIPRFVIEYGFVWQLVTYQFLHGGFFHILINMFILWMFGTELERIWDELGFLRFYLVCGIAAGLSMLAFNYTTTPVVGASGAIFGLLGAFAYHWPERKVFIWGIFPMRVKYFVFFVGLIELIMGMTETRLGVAHAAHLGGLVAGLVYVHFSDPQSPFFRMLRNWVRQRKVQKKKEEWEQRRRKRDEMVREADEILDKLQRLSWEELSEYEQRRIREISEKLDDFESWEPGNGSGT